MPTKPSGPGLLFVERCLLTVFISVLITVLFIFFISSWFSLGRLYYFLEFVHFFQVFHFIGIQLLTVVSYDPLYFCTVCCNFFFTFNFIDLSLLSFFSMSLANDLSILFIFLKNHFFSFIDLCYCCLHFFFIYFCSDLYDFPPLLTLRLFVLFLVAFGVSLGCLFDVFLISGGTVVLV